MSTGKGKKTCTEFRHVRRYKQGSHTHTISVYAAGIQSVRTQSIRIAGSVKDIRKYTSMLSQAVQRSREQHCSLNG
eukprot:1156000-Pelagomonas_calceolata.AAC.1